MSGDDYRWYGAAQIDTALTIVRLRSLDVPLEVVRVILAGAYDTDVRRDLATQLFNDIWKLLEKARRTPEEDDRLIHLAHASRLHWDNVGDNQNRVIGE